MTRVAKRVQFDFQAIRMAPRRFQQVLARAVALATAGGQRRTSGYLRSCGSTCANRWGRRRLSETTSRLSCDSGSSATAIEHRFLIIVLTNAGSLNATSGLIFSVCSQPFQPCRVGSMPEPAQQANGKAAGCWQLSVRSKYRRMFSALHELSPVNAAIESHSAFCGATKNIAL